MIKTVHLGTRGSALARWQTNHISDLLSSVWPGLTVTIQVIKTQGDRVLDVPLPSLGGKGVFTAELESALREHSIDFAVHSLKDLPTENSPGLTIGAIAMRANAQDALISRASYTLRTLPAGAVVGTSSRRRAAQILHLRPDLHMADIRGNIDTRIRRALDAEGIYDAIILASAGLERLGQMQLVSELLTLENMLPAPGQGALGVQCRDETESLDLLAPINHTDSEIAVTAERAFLAGLGGGCALPIAAYALVENDHLYLRGRVTAPDGSQQIDVELNGQASGEEAQQIGHQLAQIALSRGVAPLLETLA